MKLSQTLRVVVAIGLISLPVAVLAQHQHDSQKSDATPTPGQQSFELMKSVQGRWEGAVTVTPEQPQWKDPKPIQISLRVTSRGNALVHEMQEANTQLDPTKYDHPVTMFFVDNGQLNLVHYCDAGNRPHMIGKSSPDGKTVEFEFHDLSGSDENGHMFHVVFTLIDANHHSEDWTYKMGDQSIVAHFDLHRVDSGGAAGAL